MTSRPLNTIKQLWYKVVITNLEVFVQWWISIQLIKIISRWMNSKLVAASTISKCRLRIIDSILKFINRFQLKHIKIKSVHLAKERIELLLIQKTIIKKCKIILTNRGNKQCDSLWLKIIIYSMKLSMKLAQLFKMKISKLAVHIKGTTA